MTHQTQLISSNPIKRSILLAAVILAAAMAVPTARGQVPPQPDPVAANARMWATMFNGMKAIYSITVVVVAFEHSYEIGNVTAMEAKGQFLILRQKGKGNRDFRVVIHASNVLLIREGEEA